MFIVSLWACMPLINTFMEVKLQNLEPVTFKLFGLTCYFVFQNCLKNREVNLQNISGLFFSSPQPLPVCYKIWPGLRKLEKDLLKTQYLWLHRQIFRFLSVEIDPFSFLNKISESLCHGTYQLDFLFKIKHYIVEGPKYSIKNTTNFDIIHYLNYYNDAVNWKFLVDSLSIIWGS